VLEKKTLKDELGMSRRNMLAICRKSQGNRRRDRGRSRESANFDWSYLRRGDLPGIEVGGSRRLTPLSSVVAEGGPEGGEGYSGDKKNSEQGNDTSKGAWQRGPLVGEMNTPNFGYNRQRWKDPMKTRGTCGILQGEPRISVGYLIRENTESAFIFVAYCVVLEARWSKRDPRGVL